jgi:hypothetical protein
MARINFLISLAIASLLLACSEPALEEVVVLPAEEERSDYFLEKGALMGIHFGVQKENVSLEESRNFLRYTFFPSWKNLCPGSRVFYMRPDRGPRVGTEVFFWVFQDKAARDHYFPDKDFPSVAYEELWGVVDWLYTDTTFFKYFQYGWQTSGYSSDYEVITMKDSLQREWLQDDAVLVFQHYQLKPSADSLAFERFLMEQWGPTASYSSEQGNCIKAFLKITRGYREGEYALLNVFQTIQDRNKAFPYEGQPQNARQEQSPIAEQLWTYLEPSSAGEGHFEVIY